MSVKPVASRASGLRGGPCSLVGSFTPHPVFPGWIVHSPARVPWLDRSLPSLIPQPLGTDHVNTTLADVKKKFQDYAMSLHVPGIDPVEVVGSYAVSCNGRRVYCECAQHIYIGMMNPS
eukprot:gene11246-biopygen1713